MLNEKRPINVGFIGTGNMGGALATAVNKVFDARLLLTDHDQRKATQLALRLGRRAIVMDVAAVVAKSDYLLLGVKPQALPELLETVRPMLAARLMPPVLVSMAAGVSVARLTELLGITCPTIRIMPNTPVAVGEGVVLYAGANGINTDQLEQFCLLLGAAGRLVSVPERLIDAGCALSGCGPAFAYLFIEGLADGAVECGLPRQVATELAAQTVLGAAKMVLSTGRTPGELKDAVCSPGGTTICGVHALERAGLRCAAMDAVAAAYEKTCEMAKE